MSDEAWMRMALQEAAEAAAEDEVPVGCIVVGADGAVLSRAHNLREALSDPTAHAEMEAIREAAGRLGTWHLDGCTLVVTLEPCPMCAGALINARVATLVYGASDPKAGACGTLMNLVEDARFNHRVIVRRGTLAGECAAALKTFFEAKR
jgi:tRNA(adenine34) deaminase